MDLLKFQRVIKIFDFTFLRFEHGKILKEY